MFYVNDDDIEGLFRTAAENYDINAEQAADFNSVLKGLNEGDGGEEQKPEKKKRRFLAFWWVLLLPLLGLLLWNSTFFRQDDRFNKQSTEQNSSNGKALQQDGAGTANNSATEQADKTTGQNIYEPPANIVEQKEGDARDAKTLNADLTNEIASKRTDRTSINYTEAVVKNHAVQKTELPSQTNEPALLETKPMTEKEQQTITNPYPIPVAEDKTTKLTETATAAGITDSSRQLTVSGSLKDSVTKKEKNRKKSTTLKPNYFYAGLAASVDMTFIKFQKTTTPGFNAGFIAGYRLNKKWQIETGLIIDKKNYYTHGDYFDKSKVPYLNYVDLKSVDGFCNMFEIPLNARFNFSEKKNHLWFASAGVSSYLMKKEYYDYGYVYNGSYNHRDYTYTTTEKDWMAVINLSAGYELKAGSKSYLRFEPYYKIPVKGVGTGSLPLSSAGINVAFTRRIP